MVDCVFILQDEPKSGLCDFLEENSIDLVIVGYVSTSRLRKTLNVRSSTHMLIVTSCGFLAFKTTPASLSL